jgi:hypothetical protein
MATKLNSLSVLGLLLLTTAPALPAPGLLWDNGRWDGYASVASERNTWTTEATVADDFVLALDARVTALRAEVEVIPTYKYDTADWLIYVATPNGPGDVVWQALGAQYDYEIFGSGQLQGRRVTTPVVLRLPRGQYFLGVRMVGDFAGRAFLWSAGKGTIKGLSMGYFRSAHFGFPDWTRIDDRRLIGSPTDFSITIYGHYLGDLNCDSTVNFADINPFVLALTDPDEYARRYPACDIRAGDVNDDGAVDFGDINPFVELLQGTARPWY